MSEENSIEALCMAKIKEDFNVFAKRKKNADKGINEKVRTHKLSEIEACLEGHQIPETAAIEEMYKAHAEALRQEVHDGNFKEMKKCEYCKRFYQDYENKKGILPCPKMQAHHKMMDIDRELVLAEEEYKEAACGQLNCGKLYLPIFEQEIADDIFAELEREQLETIDEWEAIALLGLDNL